MMLLTALLMVAVSCGNESPDKETRIRMALEEKVSLYRSSEYEKCINGLKDRAIAEVDSLLRIRSKTQKIDTISPPSRFSRPQRPDLTFDEFEEPQPLEIDSPPAPGK